MLNISIHTKAEADAAYHRRQGAKERKRTGGVSISQSHKTSNGSVVYSASTSSHSTRMVASNTGVAVYQLPPSQSSGLSSNQSSQPHHGANIAAQFVERGASSCPSQSSAYVLSGDGLDGVSTNYQQSQSYSCVLGDGSRGSPHLTSVGLPLPPVSQHHPVNIAPQFVGPDASLSTTRP